jgi:hypothetical protein
VQQGLLEEEKQHIPTSSLHSPPQETLFLGCNTALFCFISTTYSARAPQSLIYLFLTFAPPFKESPCNAALTTPEPGRQCFLTYIAVTNILPWQARVVEDDSNHFFSFVSLLLHVLLSIVKIKKEKKKKKKKKYMKHKHVALRHVANTVLWSTYMVLFPYLKKNKKIQMRQKPPKMKDKNSDQKHPHPIHHLEF